MRTGPAPVASDTDQEQLVQQVQIVEVRTPYPTTAPNLRSLTIFNGSSQSLYQITVGWLNDASARQCPASPSAYSGQQQVFVSVLPGQMGRTMGDFPPEARLFCILGALSPGVPQPSEPQPEPAK